MAQAARTIDLATWKAMSAEERELVRLDDAISALETVLAERRAAEPAAEAAAVIVAEIAERASVPRRQVARVMEAMRELLAERAGRGLRSD
jgi:predicted RNA-binding protein associated with RNAse of E/G family